MHTFNFHRPASLEQAAKLFKQSEDARYVAGGQSLLPALKMRLAGPKDLIELSGIAELRAIGVEGQTLSIGALLTHAAVANSKEVRAKIPALAKLAEGIGDRQVRNCGTLGGALANNDPAACYPAAVLALNATIKTDRRDIAAEDFFKGQYETALEPGEIVQAVVFPIPERAAYVKFAQPASRFALVGVCVAKTISGVRCAVTGAGPSVFRASAIEVALSKDFAATALNGVTIGSKELNSDIHGSAEYRAHLIVELAKGAVTLASA